MLCPAASIERAAFRLAIVVGDDVAGSLQHIVVTPKETAVKVSFAQAYHIVSLAKNGTIPLFVRRVELAGLPTERNDGCQPDVGIVGFHRQQCFSRKHVKACRHAAKEVADARMVATRDCPFKIGFQLLSVLVADKTVSCERCRLCNVCPYHHHTL